MYIKVRCTGTSPVKHNSYLKSLAPDSISSHLVTGSDASKGQEAKLRGEI